MFSKATRFTMIGDDVVKMDTSFPVLESVSGFLMPKSATKGRRVKTHSSSGFPDFTAWRKRGVASGNARQRRKARRANIRRIKGWTQLAKLASQAAILGMAGHSSGYKGSFL